MRGTYHPANRAHRLRNALATAAILVCGTPWIAYAASVYGVARGPDGKAIAQQSFLVLSSKGEALKTVTTDVNGRYSVFLKPGIYRVRLGTTWEATLQSLADPSQQDIHFRVPNKK